MWLFSILVVLALGGVAMVAAGRGGSLAAPERDRVRVLPGSGPLSASDLRRVRFPLAVRGYRMADVDALLDRLADQLPDEPGEGRPRHDAPPESG